MKEDHALCLLNIQGTEVITEMECRSGVCDFCRSCSKTRSQNFE